MSKTACHGAFALVWMGENVEASFLHVLQLPFSPTKDSLHEKKSVITLHFLIPSGQVVDISSLAELFQEIQPGRGKYAVTGNHEFYVGLKRSIDFMKEAGFTVLRGQKVDIGGAVILVGVDDPALRDESDLHLEQALLSTIPRAVSVESPLGSWHR